MEIEGQPIISYGGFQELLKNLDDEGPPIGPLAAWFIGEPVTPADVHDCMEIAVRARAKNDRAHELIDMICQEIERCFPEDFS